MGVGAGLYMYVVVVQKFTFAISSPDEFLLYNETCSRLFFLYCRNCPQDDNFRYFIPILRTLGAV